MKDVLIVDNKLFVRDVEDEDEDDGGWEEEEIGDIDDINIFIDECIEMEELRYIYKDEKVYNKDWNVI
jgi:hypothetical protein